MVLGGGPKAFRGGRWTDYRLSTEQGKRDSLRGGGSCDFDWK